MKIWKYLLADLISIALLVFMFLFNQQAHPKANLLLIISFGSPGFLLQLILFAFYVLCKVLNKYNRPIHILLFSTFPIYVDAASFYLKEDKIITGRFFILIVLISILVVAGYYGFLVRESRINKMTNDTL